MNSMRRPYTICHMLSSIDGKIDGTYYSCPEMKPVRAASNEIRMSYEATGVLYGATTMAEVYGAGYISELPHTTEIYKRSDHIVDRSVNNFYIAVDTKGTIAWESNYTEKKGRPKAHLVTILTEDVSDDYISHLRSVGISYIFAGRTDLDCQLAMEKLKSILGIEKLLICGGGLVNYTFLYAGLIDEVSLVIAPLTDGGYDVASVFDQMKDKECIPFAFSLLEAKVIDGDGVLLRYKPVPRSLDV